MNNNRYTVIDEYMLISEGFQFRELFHKDRVKSCLFSFYTASIKLFIAGLGWGSFQIIKTSTGTELKRRAVLNLITVSCPPSISLHKLR